VDKPSDVCALHRHIAVVVAVKVDDALPPLNSLWIAGHGDDVFNNDVIGQHIEVIIAVNKAFQSFSNDVEEGSIAPKF